MIELETRLTDAASRLPGPDAEATERARAHVLAAFAPPAYAPRADLGDPAERVDAGDQPAALPLARPALRRRRILAVGAGLATVAALAVAVIVAGLPHGAAPPGPPAGTGTPSVDNVPARLDGTIAYVRDDVLWTVTDGGKPVELARLPAVDDSQVDTEQGGRALAVSPDGRRVAVVSAGGANIYDRATGDAETIPMAATSSVSGAFFSADGNTLFVRDRFGLFAVTDRARSLPSGASDAVAVAPDGSGIAVNGAGKSGLVVLDNNGENARTIKTNPTGAAGNVVWGPGADQPIAYVDRAGTHVISAATPGATPLLIGFDKYPLTFTRDGSELIVQTAGPAPLLEAISIDRQSDGSGTRYTVGPSRRVATASADGASYFGMTRDGTAILVGSGNGPRDLRLVPVDGGPAQPTGIGAADALAWSGMALPTANAAG